MFAFGNDMFLFGHDMLLFGNDMFLQGNDTFLFGDDMFLVGNDMLLFIIEQRGPNQGGKMHAGVWGHACTGVGGHPMLAQTSVRVSLGRETEANTI